jgi:hypothetical protein
MTRNDGTTAHCVGIDCQFFLSIFKHYVLQLTARSLVILDIEYEHEHHDDEEWWDHYCVGTDSFFLSTFEYLCIIHDLDAFWTPIIHTSAYR